MKNDKMVYILVMVCLHTKFTELILIDSRNTSSLLSAMNIVFSLYGVPSLIILDREGAMLKVYKNLDKINECPMIDHQIQISLIPAFLHHFQGSVEAKIRQMSSMMGTLDIQASSLIETELSNTLRIISAFVNKQTYCIKFCSNSDKSIATGLAYTMSQIEFLAPVSFLNPTLEDRYQPILVDSINSSQKLLLKKLGLAEKIYKEEVLPKLLITLDLDHKRLSSEDEVKVGQIVLVHCTPCPDRKFEKAVLAS